MDKGGRVISVQTAAPGWRFESESPASNDAFTARRRSNRSVEFTRPFSQANFDGGFCTNLCANPSRSGNVTRRRLFGPTFFTRYDSEPHLHTPRHRRSLPAAFARPSTFLAIRNPPPTPSATARYTLSQIPHQHTSQNACCHVPFFLLLTSNEL